MTNTRPFRVTFVFEYGQDNADWMLTSLIQSLQSRLPDMQVGRVHGLFREYHPGGLHPSRVVNLGWVYLRVAVHLLFSRPDAVLVRSSPPGIQLWTVWLAKWRGIPVYCWLMDYHPEMEARLLQRKGYLRSARLLQRIDAAFMPDFAAIIALDEAMANFAATRAQQAEVLQHPTWGKNHYAESEVVAYSPGADREAIRLAYSGNLGAAHDIAVLTDLIRELAGRRPVFLYVIGASAGGEERFRGLEKQLGVSVTTHPRVPFGELRGLYEKWKIDAGIVLLAAESAGLVSPSKFSGYVNFGIPLIYIGPPGTNTAEVCKKFGGGWWIPTDARKNVVQEAAGSLLNGAAVSAHACAAKEAARYFSNLNSESLADLLASRFARLRPGTQGKSKRASAGESGALPLEVH